MRQPIVTQAETPPPFDPVYFDTVFFVPMPPAEWPPVFAIVTAHNPDGEVAAEVANNHYERELDRYLRSQGIDAFAVVGASRDLRHHESGRGFAVGDIAFAASVSARFRQVAFFWVEDGIVFLCNDASGKGWQVGPWKERLALEPPGRH